MKYTIKTIAAICGFICFNTMAQSSTASLKTSVKVSPKCDLSVGNIAFGQYFPGQGDSFASSDISLKCTNGTSAQIGINHTGTNPYHVGTTKYSYTEGGISYTRYMTSGGVANRLNYNLFQDSAYTKVFGGANWFTTTAGSRPIVIGDGSIRKIPIFAAMAGNQYVRVGSYMDSLIVDIVF